MNLWNKLRQSWFLTLAVVQLCFNCEQFTVMSFFSAGGTFPRFAGKAKTSGLIVPEKLDLRFSEKKRLERRNNGGIFSFACCSCCCCCTLISSAACTSHFFSAISFNLALVQNLSFKVKNECEIYILRHCPVARNQFVEFQKIPDRFPFSDKAQSLSGTWQQ